MMIKKWMFGLLSVFVFILWFSKGFNMPIKTDAMKEAVSIIDFRFPNMLFTTPSMTGEGIWHRSRWSADILSYLSFNGISKIIAFFTGDIVGALFIGQGLYIGLMFTALVWIMALYGWAVIPRKSGERGFIYVFVLSVFAAIHMHFPSFLSDYLQNKLLIIDEPPFLSNYLWSIVLVLGALYPYWNSLVNPTRERERERERDSHSGAFNPMRCLFLSCSHRFLWRSSFTVIFPAY